MLKSPFRTSNKVIVTQEYGNTSSVEWYKANGINIPYHNGIDIILGDSRLTYGAECVCPFPKAKVVKVTFDTPTSTKGNGVTMEADYEGFKYQVVFWHTGEVPVKLGQVLKEGDVICYVGNSGLCSPSPTEYQPWNGSHCHLMLFKYSFDGLNWNLFDRDNGVGGAINPRELFDFLQFYYDKDTGFSHDLFVLKPFIKATTNVVDYFRKIGLIK